jgi:hypothetical protein
VTNTHTNSPTTHLLPATAAGNGMGALCLGSLRSWAAARSLIAAREAMGDEGILFRVSVMANPGQSGTHCNCKGPRLGQTVICKCFMPSAITEGLL